MTTETLPTPNGSHSSYGEQFRRTGDAISVLDLLIVLTRSRTLISYTLLLFTVLGVLYALVSEPEFTASATVIREVANDNASTFVNGLSALRGFGIDLGGTSTGLTADAYPEIANSREVLLAVVRDTFRIKGWDRPMSLVEYTIKSSRFSDLLEHDQNLSNQLDTTTRSHDNSTPSTFRLTRAEVAAIQHLENCISTSVDPVTGLMTISATTNNPELSTQVVQSLISHLTTRIRQLRTEKARTNVEFIRQRFQEAERSLHTAEEELARFLDRNNNPQTASLRTNWERLQRKVSFKSQLYADLQLQLTNAEIELQKTQPVITVVEEPLIPVEPSSPSLKLIIILSIIAGLFCGICLSFARTLLVRHSATEETESKLEEIKKALVPRGATNSIIRLKQLLSARKPNGNSNRTPSLDQNPVADAAQNIPDHNRTEM